MPKTFPYAKFDKPYPKDSSVRVYNLWFYEDKANVASGHISLYKPVPHWKQWILHRLLGWHIAWGSEYGGPRDEYARGKEVLSFCTWTTLQAKDGIACFQGEQYPLQALEDRLKEVEHWYQNLRKTFDARIANEMLAKAQKIWSELNDIFNSDPPRRIAAQSRVLRDLLKKLIEERGDKKEPTRLVRA